jgi:YfiH family protein
MQFSAPLLDRLDGIAHGFFTREGGVSGGIYASLNCGFGSRDRTEHVAENRARVAAALDLPAEALLTVYQVHSPDVVTVTRTWRPDGAPRADAMVTREPGVALSVLAADCAPVLFADSAARIVGAAHAGWKGALGGVVEATIARMVELGATRAAIVASVGPCIAQASYEVGDEFRDRFVVADPAHARFFADGTRPGHCQFDLPGFVRSRLEAAGIGGVETLDRDTYADEGLFSYRRATHRSEGDYGRNLSAIAIVGAD